MNGLTEDWYWARPSRPSGPPLCPAESAILLLPQAPLRSTREHFWQMVFECQHTHVVSLTNPGAAELWAKHVVVPCLYRGTSCPAPTSLSAPKSWAPCLTLLLLASLIDTVMCFHPPTSMQAHMNVQPVTTLVQWRTA